MKDSELRSYQQGLIELIPISKSTGKPREKRLREILFFLGLGPLPLEMLTIIEEEIRFILAARKRKK